MYGGWSGHATAANQAFDEIFVLTIPAFEWIQVSYTPKNPRHALTCHAVGGSQILTIGGLDSDDTSSNSDAYLAVFGTPDPFTQGLNIFDLHTLWWADHYSASPQPYHQSSSIQKIYAAK